MCETVISYYSGLDASALGGASLRGGLRVERKSLGRRGLFHGLGNGCVVTSALSPAQDHPARAAWAQRRKAMFGFEPDPTYTLAPFHPEAVNAFLGTVRIGPDGAIAAGIIPVHVEAPGRPVLASGERADAIRRYLEQITVAAGLPPIHVAEDGRIEEVSA